jgi:hypothetical protein
MSCNDSSKTKGWLVDSPKESTGETPSTEAKIEVAVEATAVDRLEALAEGQGQIFDKIHADRVRSFILATAVLVVFAIFGLVIYRQATKTDDIQASRNEGLVGACLQDNVRIDQHNKLVDATDATLNATAAVQVEIDTILGISVVPRPAETPAQTKAREDFIVQSQTLKKTVDDAAAAARIANTGSRVAQRDCTLAGVNRYLRELQTHS